MAISQTDLENQLHNELVQSVEKLKKLGIKSNRFSQMLNKYGAVKTAKIVLNANDYPDGYIDLLTMKRTDLSVEYICRDKKYAPLFTPEELKIAYDRLPEETKR